jgi:hypothetical protein
MSIPKEIVAMLRANGIEIASFDAMTASIRLRRPTAGAVIKADAKLEARLAEIAAASQWGLNITGTNKQDNFNYRTSADVR